MDDNKKNEDSRARIGLVISRDESNRGSLNILDINSGMMINRTNFTLIEGPTYLERVREFLNSPRFVGIQTWEEEEEIEIPFDLNKLFSMSYGFEPLKEVLTDIYKRLHGNSKDVNALDMKLTAKFLEIS
mgnify:CR=1 FL=1